MRYFTDLPSLILFLRSDEEMSSDGTSRKLASPPYLSFTSAVFFMSDAVSYPGRLTAMTRQRENRLSGYLHVSITLNSSAPMTK